MSRVDPESIEKSESGRHRQCHDQEGCGRKTKHRTRIFHPALHAKASAARRALIASHGKPSTNAVTPSQIHRPKSRPSPGSRRIVRGKPFLLSLDGICARPCFTWAVSRAWRGIPCRPGIPSLTASRQSHRSTRAADAGSPRPPGARRLATGQGQSPRCRADRPAGAMRPGRMGLARRWRVDGAREASERAGVGKGHCFVLVVNDC